MSSRRTDFPIFSNNPNLNYLDSASSTQKSSYVIDKASKYGFKISDLIEGYIHPESVGAESSVKNDILTYLVEFERE